MSRIPNSNTNTFRTILYRAGEKAGGSEYANIAPDYEVRRKGLKHLAKAAGKVALVTALTVGSFLHIADRQDGEARIKEENFQNEQTSNEMDRLENAGTPPENSQQIENIGDVNNKDSAP